jgi:iron complex outermembrane receptor protein
VARTDASGAYALEIAPGQWEFAVVAPGRQSVTRRLTVSESASGVDFSLSSAVRISEDVVVSAVRADSLAPVSRADLAREEIVELDTHGQEMPALLQSTPSVTGYSDTGLGNGYAYMWLRGIQSTRINFTLDGVPLSDAEDSALYFVDFGEFAQSLQSVQVQRGVGTSTVGAASYGGSVNFESIGLTDNRQVSVLVGAGSFGSNRASVGFQSGMFGRDMKFYARVSYLDTDGFRDHSGVKQGSLFLGLSHEDSDSYLKIFGFIGHEKTQLAFLAVEKDVLEHDLRFNPLPPDNTDSFGQSFVQAQYTRSLGDASSLSVQGYYNGAGGWYRLDSDADPSVLLQYNLDWRFLGGVVSYRYTGEHFSLTAGVHGNDFVSTHTQDTVGGGQNYSNNNTKNEANAFAKGGYDLGRWHLFADAQVRWARFRYQGDIPLGSVSWTFFNPKVGARYQVSPATSIYASLGQTSREPARSDMLLGEDNATVYHDLHAVHPERVADAELGVDSQIANFSIKADLYDMEFHNEIALTGQLSEIGLPLRRNVGRSYRRGVEIDVGGPVAPAVRVQATANFSYNRILQWTQFYDLYDTDGNLVGSTSRTFADVNPLLTPEAVANLGVEYMPWPNFTVGAAGRYSARSFLDNTNDPALTTPSFFDFSASAALSLSPWIKVGEPQLRLQIANLFDNHHLFPSGYSYLFAVKGAGGEETLQGIPYYYPTATRSVYVTLNLNL